MNKIITAVAKPFSTFPRGAYKFLVEADGTVTVWDEIAEHYTHCHSMSARTMARIRHLASDADDAHTVYCHGCGDEIAANAAIWHTGEPYCDGCDSAPSEV